MVMSASSLLRRGSKPRGNSLGSSAPSSPAGGGMATEDMALDTKGSSSSLERKKLTSTGGCTYRKTEIKMDLKFYESLLISQGVKMMLMFHINPKVVIFHANHHYG